MDPVASFLRPCHAAQQESDSTHLPRVSNLPCLALSGPHSQLSCPTTPPRPAFPSFFLSKPRTGEKNSNDIGAQFPVDLSTPVAPRRLESTTRTPSFPSISGCKKSSQGARISTPQTSFLCHGHRAPAKLATPFDLPTFSVSFLGVLILIADHLLVVVRPKRVQLLVRLVEARLPTCLARPRAHHLLEAVNDLPVCAWPAPLPHVRARRRPSPVAPRRRPLHQHRQPLVKASSPRSPPARRRLPRPPSPSSSPAASSVASTSSTTSWHLLLPG
nr:uncharacterized protein LOC127326188 [Lolium perenne]